MYSDKRNQESTPEHWNNVFIPQKSITQSSLYNIVFNINRLLFDVQWREIRRSVKKGSVVLDAGCGMGQWVMFLRRQGMDAMGLDYSEAMVKLLALRFPKAKWIEGSIQAIPLPDKSVDSIISWGVIEHDQAGPGKALNEFYRILKPGGTIFVTVPYDTPAMRRAAVIHNTATENNSSSEGTKFYQYFMTENELESNLKDSNFEIQKVIPSIRHYSVLFPKLYLRLQCFGALGEAIMAQILRPYLMYKRDSYTMILGIGKKRS